MPTNTNRGKTMKKCSQKQEELQYTYTLLCKDIDAVLRYNQSHLLLQISTDNKVTKTSIACLTNKNVISVFNNFIISFLVRCLEI